MDKKNISPSTSSTYEYEEDTISLKEIILTLQSYWAELYSYKWFIILFASLLAALFLARSFFQETKYEAVLTFMIEEDKGSAGVGGIASILGQFGFGGGASSEYNLDKISELARSRRIIKSVSLERKEINGKTDYLANHVIEIYDLWDEWLNDTLLNNIAFTHNDLAKFTLGEQMALEIIYDKIVGNASKGVAGLMKIKYQEETGILHINTGSIEESLTIHLANTLYEKLSEFYISESIEKPKQTFDLLNNRADSVLISLKAAQRKLAYLDDRSSGILMKKDRLKREQLSMDVQILTILYGEILKNKETSEFILKSNTPFFQVIDEPNKPLEKNEPSKLGAIIIGGFLGGFLAVSFFFFRTLYRRIMAEE